MDVSRMIAIFGSYGFGDAPTQDLVDMLNGVYHDICDLEAWPFLEKEIDLTLDGSTAVPTNLPTDLQAVVSLVDEVTGIELLPMRIEDIYRYYGTNLTYPGNPQFFYFTQNQLRIFPIGSASTSINKLHLTYVQATADLSSSSLSTDIVIPSRYHWAIVYGVLSMLYLEEDDQAQSDYFQNRMDRTIQRMRRSIWQRQFVRPDYIDSGNDDFDFYGGLFGAAGFGNGI